MSDSVNYEHEHIKGEESPISLAIRHSSVRSLRNMAPESWRSEDATDGTGGWEANIHAENERVEYGTRRVSCDGETEDFLKVTFEESEARRRKSSLVPSTRSSTQCFVHTLLEKHDGLPIQDVGLSYEGLAQEQHVDKDPHNHSDQIHHSRLLTKKQISDMAFGIRDLSKKLAQLRLQLTVKNVFVLGKAHDDKLVGLERELCEWLLKEYGDMNVFVEDTMKENETFNAKSLLEQNESYKKRLRYWDIKLCQEQPQMFDIVLALGGDGTVLYASWLFQRVVPPVLSFSLGSLGFLTKFDFPNYPATLQRAFTTGITVSLRLRFEATVMRSQNHIRNGGSADLVEELIGEEIDNHYTHKPESTHNILNEVVVDRGPNPTMSTIELFGDDEHFTTIQADGVCIATPTGSTAYNLAAGGSLCHPDNPVVLVTAICAHTLSFRPIILPDTVVLRAGVPYDARTSSWASFDGRERVELKPGDYVTISVSRYPFSSVLPLEGRSGEWIESISRTLQWNSRQRQKAFDKDWESGRKEV